MNLDHIYAYEKELKAAGAETDKYLRYCFQTMPVMSRDNNQIVKKNFRYR